MAVYQYPKSKHSRKLLPPRLKRYGSYKRYLQYEFKRVCVYCREPDSHSSRLVFQVDHYRPKSLPRFAALETDYTNLYYCCGSCNSRKNNYWPADEATHAWIVNPCEHEMASHLRFNASTGSVEWRSIHGEWTVELLALNDEATVQARLHQLRTLKRIVQDRAELLAEAAALKRQLRDGVICQAQFDSRMNVVDNDLSDCKTDEETVTGDLVLPALPRRGGLILHAVV
jgi:HNH endonuclease